MEAFEASSLDGLPGMVASEVLPHALKAPVNLDLTIREMFQKTVHHQSCHIAPIGVAAIREFLLQNRANRNCGGKCIPKQQELNKEVAVQDAEASRCHDADNAQALN